MRRTSLALSLAIVLQGVACVAFIAWWTSRPAASASSPDPADEAAGAVAEPLPAAGSAADGAALAEDPAPPLRVTPPAAEPVRPPRSARSAAPPVPAATRASLVSFRREMKAGLGALQRRVARCGATDAWFTLEVETVEGGIRVIEAHVEFPGSGGEASIACARSLLLGETIPAPSATPGRRWELSFAPGSAM